MSNTPNKYVVDDESGAEMARLINQGKMITRAMGGVFPPIDLSGIRDVLDIGCGPGGWVRDVAFEHRKMAVMGIDINKGMIKYANAFAEVGHLDNAQYEVQDATCTLDFPNASFDFINARFIAAFMPDLAAWQELVGEMARIARPGGILRLTECDDPGTTNSPAYQKMTELAIEAGRRDGRINPIRPRLAGFLRDTGCQDIQVREHVLDFSIGTQEYANMFDDVRAGFRLIQPFIAKMGLATQEELNQLYQWTMIEMRQDTFEGKWYFTEAWGRMPGAA